MSTPTEIVSHLRKSFNAGLSRPSEWRSQQLKKIVQLIDENKETAYEALYKDLRQTPFMADLTEIELPKQEALYHLDNLSSWMRPDSKSIDTMFQPAQGYVMREPLGVVLIISPWNYPISLLLKPLIGAISAGNCVVLKPSEVSENSANWLQHCISNYLDNECIRVYPGGPDETELLLKERFDLIFYTGSTLVGKVIMRAAAEYLTPVILELGGKSPCIVDKNADLETSARRICCGKFSNAGQTCVAPDYLLVHKDIEEQFIQKLKQAITEFYGTDPQASKDFTRIINERHTKRLQRLLEGQQEIILGGSVDVSDNYISPTLVKISKTEPSPLMQEEIFGPILPIMTIDDIDEAIEFVNDRPKPLALYIFSNSSSTQKKLLENTSSGGASVNETVYHVVCKNLPFGGVGPSGMGSYNGFTSFDTFSHKKSVLERPTWIDPSVRYPPFTPRKIWWFRTLTKLKLPWKD